MQPMITILELLPNLIEACIFIYIISHCLELRFSGKRIFLLVILQFSIITFFSETVTIVPLRIFLLLAIELIITISCTKRTSLSLQLFYGSIRTLFSLFSEKLAIFSSELLIGYPLESIDEISIIRYWLIFLYLLLLSLFSFLFVSIKNQTLMFPTPLLFFFLLGVVFVIVSSELLLHVIISLEKSNVSYNTTLLQLLGIGFLLLIGVLFLLVIYIGKLYEKNLSLTEQKKQLLLEQNQLSTLQKANAFLRSWKHDFQNHMHTLAQMLYIKDYQSCQQYVETLTNEVQYAKENLYTGNPAIDAVLSLKFFEIHSKQIKLTYEIFLPGNQPLPLNDVKFSSILNNILENAIEACHHVKNDAFITFSMKQYHSQLLIQTTNSSNGIYLYSPDHHLLSTKTKGNHGNGLKRIQTIIEEVGGFCDISPEKEQFSITILIPYKTQKGNETSCS